MGIKNLLKFLSENTDTVINKTDKDFCHKKIAIDISIIIYQSVIAIRNSGSDLTNDKGEITSHILGLFNRTLSFLDKGIIPVYVFDGKPPKLKQKILDARKVVKQKALEKLSETTNEADKIKYLKRSVNITKEQMEQCRELLDFMGIPYIDAPEEADSQLSYLCKSSMVYAVLTEDMDILTFGSPKIIRNLTSHKKSVIEISLDNILEKLKLTNDEFIELCILFGCDYCPHLSDIKPEILYKTFIKNKNLDKTLLELKNMGHNVPDIFNYQDAKDYFKEAIHTPIEPNILKLKDVNDDKLVSLLVDKYGLIKYKVLNKLKRLKEYYKNLNLVE
jgi:flap endonuclease-1